MALKKIFDPKRDKVTGEWRRIHNEDIHNFYSSPYITRVVKLRRIRWARHVARMRGRGQMRTWFWCGNLRQECHAEDIGVGGRIILKKILRNGKGLNRLDLLGPQGDEAGVYNRGNETRVSQNAGNLLTNSRLFSFSREVILHFVRPRPGKFFFL